MKKSIMSIILILVFSMMSFAEVDIKFYGLQWLDYVVGFDGNKQDYSEFKIPRTYLRFSATDKDAGYKGHVTVDINNVSGAQDGLDWGVWLKYAYVDFVKIPFISDAGIKMRVGLQKVYFGTVDTWEYPLTEKPFADKNKIVSSADQGVAILGNLFDKMVSYEIAAYNGTGYKSEENDFDKVVGASIIVRPVDFVYARGSYLRDNSGGASAFVLGLQSDIVDCHIEYVTATRGRTSEGISLFVSANIIDELSLNIRYDVWNPDTYVDLDETNLYIAGVNWEINQNIVLQLDYELIQPKVGNGISNQNKYISRVSWKW